MNKADLHHKSNIMPKRDALIFLEEYSSKLNWNKKFSRILDIGCGDGSVTNMLKEYISTDYQLLGCDISENMVKFANNQHYDKQTSFTVLDIAGDLPEGMKGNFDFVFSNYAIHWIHDQEHVFNSIYNLLDDEGEFFLIFVAYIPIFDIYRALSQNNKWSPYMKNVETIISPYHDSQEPEREVRNIAENIGFVDIDVKCEALSFWYEDIDIFKMSMTAINPFNIPNEMHDEFMEDYYELLKEMKIIDKYDKDYVNGATLNYNLIVFHARKTGKNIS